MVAGEYSPYIRLLKLFRLPKVSEITKFTALVQTRDGVKMALRISRLVLYIFLYLHFIACAWYVIVLKNQVWIPVTDVILEASPFYGESPVYQYAYCFYIAVCALVSIEIYPQTTEEIGFVLGTLIMSAMFISYILGEITDAVGSFDAKENLFKNHMGRAITIMQHFVIHPRIQNHVKEYLRDTYRYIVKNNECDSFIRNLHPQYIKRVNSHLYGSIISKQPLFARCRKAVVYVMVRLKIAFIKPESKLIGIGEHPDKLCFVIEGTFNVQVYDLSGNYVYVRSLYQGDICGEIGLIYSKNCTATVKAAIYSTAALLSKPDFSLMLSHFPSLRSTFKEKISQYNDPYRQELKRILHRLPYTRNIGKSTLDKIILSLEPHTFQNKEVIISSGSVLNAVYLLVEGEVELLIELNDQSLVVTQTNPEDSVFTRRATYRKCIQICSLDPGSIISGTVSLFHAASPFICRARSLCTLLVLRTKLLEGFAQADPALRENIQRLKKKYIHVNSLLNTKILILPVLDYIKHFPVESGKFTYKALQKAKNIIFMCILRSRFKIPRKWISFKTVIKKLYAVSRALRNDMKEIAQRIERNELLPQIVDVAKYLKHNELQSQILAQFAQVAELTESQLFILGSQRKELSERLAALSVKRSTTRRHLESLLALLTD